MRRRALLASLGTTLAAAGCLGNGSSPGGVGEPTGTDEPTETQSRTAEATDTSTETGPSGDGSDTEPWSETATPGDPATETPTPPTASDVFADFECPSFEESAQTVCYHEAGPDVPLVLTVDPEVFGSDTSDDVEALEFVLYNRSGERVGFNPYDWGIERYDDGDWTHVAPDLTPEPWTNLESDETFTWALPTEPHTPSDDEHRQRVAVALDPGVYAFHVSVATGNDSRSELIALFQVETAIGPQGGGDDEANTESST